MLLWGLPPPVAHQAWRKGAHAYLSADDPLRVPALDLAQHAVAAAHEGDTLRRHGAEAVHAVCGHGDGAPEEAGGEEVGAHLARGGAGEEELLPRVHRALGRRRVRGGGTAATTGPLGSAHRGVVAVEPCGGHLARLRGQHVLQRPQLVLERAHDHGAAAGDADGVLGPPAAAVDGPPRDGGHPLLHALAGHHLSGLHVPHDERAQVAAGREEPGVGGEPQRQHALVQALEHVHAAPLSGVPDNDGGVVALRPAAQREKAVP